MNFINRYLFLLIALYYQNIYACVGTDVLVDIDNVSCNHGTDGSIKILTTNISDHLPYLYSLNGGIFTSNNEFSQLSEGTYTLTIRNNDGCDLVYPDPIIITQPEVLTVDLDHTSFVCGNDAKVYANITGGIAPYIYTWNNDPTVQVDTLRNIGNGTYSLTVRDQNQCTASNSITIQSNVLFSVQVDASNTDIEIGEEILLSSTVTNGGTNLSYQWYPDNDMDCSVCSETSSRFFNDTEVRLVVHDLDNGCVASDSIFIEVNGNFSIYIPNAFSPNGDRRNDRFLVYGVGLDSALLRVYDRNGFLLFEGDGLVEGWDGSVQGQAKAADLYFYQASITYLDGSISERKGQITLIR